ncbi:MAG: lysoplasmalogenase [Leptospiraceae bacterium]|nr:lysoplasmalogenase [Leptospiraceae bacterium]
MLFFQTNVYLEIVVKCIPVLYLVILVLTWNLNYPTMQKKFLLGAVVCSVLGDFFLAAKFLNHYFLLGLGSFLVAQIFFILTFLPHSRLKLPLFIYPMAMGLIVFGYIYPTLPREMILPVMIYMFALVSMAWRASARTANKKSLWQTTLGGYLFLISDGLIALTHFGNLPVPYAQLWIMITYYAAEYLLSKGTIEE